MLESVKRAYDKNAFDEADNKCPVDLATINNYLCILQPAYIVSLRLQSNDSSICDTIPSIQYLINCWKNLRVPAGPKLLCRLLVHTVKAKFNYELNSEIYKVSSTSLYLNVYHFFNLFI
jgi:hypothetical protein